VGSYRIVPPAGQRHSWPRFRQRARAVIRAVQIEQAFDVPLEEGGRLTGKAGDYVCLGPGDRAWVMDKEIFEATFGQEE